MIHETKKAYTNIIVSFAFIAIFLLYFFHFTGPAGGYWDTYITAPALLMTNQPVDFTLKDGTSIYDYTLPGELPQNLVNHDTYGIASKDQRIGSAVLFAPMPLLFNLLGFRLLYALFPCLIGLLLFFTVKSFTGNTAVSLITAILAAANSYMFSLSSLNPNVVGMFLISLLLYLIIQGSPSWFLVGLVFGALGGVRNIGILFTPALCYILVASSSHKVRDVSLFICGALMTIAPFLYWKQFAFGNFLMHPSQFSHHEGFRPVFEHHFLFWKFNFNGMFNYPLYDKIIRTPYFAFPTFLTIPFTIIHTLGIIPCALIIIGMVSNFRYNKRIGVFLLLWFLPMCCIFMLQENWSDMKTTFILLFINPLLLWFAFGLFSLLQPGKRVRIIAIAGMLCLFLFIGVRSFAHATFEADERWYERFPRARHNRIEFLGDDLRNEAESPEYLKKQKKMLTGANVLPAVPKVTISIPDTLSRIETERKTTTLTTIDFWKYIYREEL